MSSVTFKRKGNSAMAERTFHRGALFLHMPVSDREPESFHFIQVFDGEKMEKEFYIGLVDTAKGEKPDFYVAMYLGNYISDVITLKCYESDSDTILDGIIQGNDMEDEPKLYPDLYREADRQLIHFSPRRGWMNDPNGLLCTKEGYNIHFQHNPFGPQHGCANVSWGRAVSTDGVHYKEYPDAIMPYSTRCHVASGSAVLDKYNMSGFGEDTIIAAYTALQSVQFHGRPPVVNEGQHLLYSIDGGKTYQYFPWSPIIPVPDGEEWRDPKIVQVDSLGRAAALASGTVDAVFWTRINPDAPSKTADGKALTNEEFKAALAESHPEYTEEQLEIMSVVADWTDARAIAQGDIPESTIVTDPYFTDAFVTIALKSSLGQ